MKEVNTATKRELLLDNAREIVVHERNEDYGEPEDSFGIIAELWESYLGIPVRSIDVANMMILLKVGRCAQREVKYDSLVDIAGYAACGAELL